VSLKFHHPTTTYTTTANINLSLSCTNSQVTLSLSTTPQPAFVGVTSNKYTLEVEYVNTIYATKTSSVKIDLGEGTATTSIKTNWNTATF
jgi:hypothetical protein